MATACVGEALPSNQQAALEGTVRPSYKDRGICLRLGDVADMSFADHCSSESTCVSEGGASPRGSDNGASGSHHAPTRRKVPSTLSTDVTQGAWADALEDSDEEVGSPLSKSAKRRLRRRRQREAMKTAAARVERHESSASGPKPATVATVSALGLDEVPAVKPSSMEPNFPPTPLGSEPSSVPCSPSCARMGARGVVSTSPCHKSRPSTGSDASTRIPSGPSTPAGSLHLGPIPCRALVGLPPLRTFAAPHPSSPARAAAVCLGVASSKPCGQSPCSPAGFAASHTGRPEVASAGFVHMMPGSLPTCAAPHGTQSVPCAPAMSESAAYVTTANPVIRAPESGRPSEAKVTQEVVSNVEADTLRILFGAIGPPPSAELMARLQAACPEKYDD